MGGAAINPSFVRGAAVVEQDSGAVYAPGMFYCKDAFEGLSVMDRLQDADSRAEFVRRHNEEMLERWERQVAEILKQRERPAGG